jgi:hypothetical protein
MVGFQPFIVQPGGTVKYRYTLGRCGTSMTAAIAAKNSRRLSIEKSSSITGRLIRCAIESRRNR